MTIMQRLRLLLRMNWFMTVVMLALIGFGVLFIYSACYVSDEEPVRDLYRKQIGWAIVGMAAYLGFAAIDYRALRKLAWLGYGIAMVLLVAVLFMGKTMYGAKRWLDLGVLDVQPSEIAKLAVIFLLARRLSRPGENLMHWRPLLEVLMIVAVPCLLIMQQPDLGTAIIMLPVTLAMMFVAGMPYRAIGLLILSGLVAMGLVLGLLFLPQKLGVGEEGQKKIMNAVGLSPYHRDRLEVFFNADSDPLGAGWNKRQSEIAVGSGGLKGKGYLSGTQNLLGFLPRTVAPTDFIFSVIAEERGFMGSAAMLGLFALLLASGIHSGLGAPDKLGRLLCVGLMTMIFSHVLVNTAMTVGLMPITGIPLPLLSYGGSFMMVVMSALGLVQSVHIRSQRSGLKFEQGVLWQAI